jgi:hypothetical protein
VFSELRSWQRQHHHYHFVIILDGGDTIGSLEVEVLSETLLAGRSSSGVLWSGVSELDFGERSQRNKNSVLIQTISLGSVSERVSTISELEFCSSGSPFLFINNNVPLVKWYSMKL